MGAAGPLDIRNDHILLAEFIATPGKRGDAYLNDLDGEAAARLALSSARVVGHYRRELCMKRHGYLLPPRGHPGPRAFRLKLPFPVEADCGENAVRVMPSGSSP